MSNQELYHWGIKGMRWGHRRYQNKDGSLTPEGRKRYGEDDDNDPNGKEKAVKSGNASQVARYKSQMTNQELQSAISRINLERQLSSLQEQERQSGFDKIDSMMNKVGKVTNWAETGIRAYNVIAKINNSVNSDRKLPALDGGEALSKAAKDAASAARKKYIDNLSADDAIKNFNDLTAEETSSISKRLTAEKNIKGYSSAQSTSNDSSTQTKPKADYTSPTIDIKTGTGMRGEKWIKKTKT